MSGAFLHRIRTSQDLPVLPAATRLVLDLTGSRSTELSEIAEVIARDGGAAERLLRFANLDFFGKRGAASGVREALMLLGVEKVRAAVAGISLVRAFVPLRPEAFDARWFWRRSLCAAAAASVLSVRLDAAPESSAFLVGLAMDTGMLALDRVAKDRYAKVLKNVASHADLSAAEAAELGVTHCEASAVLAKLWRLPDDVRAAIPFHHRPAEAPNAALRQLAKVAALASRCADSYADAAPLWAVADVRRMLREDFNVTEPQSGQLLREIGQRTADLTPVFDFDPAFPLAFEQVLRRASDQLERAVAEGVAGRNRPEHRAAARIKRDTDIFILSCQAGTVGPSMKVRLQDVSGSGIGILSAAPMAKGFQFIFRIRKPSGEWVTFMYEVVRRRRGTAGEFQIGARLLCTLKNGEKAEAGALRESAA